VGGVDVGEAGWERLWQFYELLGRFCCGVGEGGGSFMLVFYVGVGFAFGLASVCCWLAEVKLKKFLVTGCFLWLVQLSK
jgi:hypothetical protein